MALTEKDLAAEALAEHNAAIAADLTTAVCEAGDNSGLLRFTISS